MSTHPFANAEEAQRLRSFADLSPNQQFKAVRRIEIEFRSALARGSVALCGGKEIDIEKLARAVAEDEMYSEMDMRTYLADWTWENGK